MDDVYPIIIFFLVITGAIVITILLRFVGVNDILKSQKSKLENEVKYYRQLAVQWQLYAESKPKPTKLLVDKQTSSLLALALNNTNENEARSAALQVCRRLSSHIEKS